MLKILTGFLLYFITYLHTSTYDSTYHVVFKDVRQGDSIFINAGEAALLLDGGPSNDNLIYFSKELCPIESILLTHPHRDHIFGLNRILKLCSVQVVFSNPVEYSSQIYTEFQELTSLLDKRQLSKGDSFKFGGYTFYVLWPPTVETSFSNINDASIVVLLDYGSFEALLTGDISAEVQSQLDLEAYASVIQDGLDVYKVPHHGSKYSFDRDFLLSLKPKVAVIQVGKNSYGHPSSLFLDFFSAQNIPVYRTDIHGDIKINL